jgi:4-carboxymuconolactone decarboxylase
MGRIPYVDAPEPGSGAAHALDAVRRQRGFVSNLHRTLAHSVDALDAFEQFSRHVQSTALDVRTRELMILRTAVLSGNEYEWRRHVPKALVAGVTVEQLQRLADDDAASASGLSSADTAVLALVDEHVREGQASAASVAAVREALGDALLIEVLVTLGWYLLVTTVILSLDLLADDEAPMSLAVAFPIHCDARCPR